MNVDKIRACCLALPAATENLQWGEDLCFKIQGKIFATMALTAVPQKLCFKCTPEMFAELIERADIRPAPYVGRYKWVILDRLDALRLEETEDLIRQSYEMVSEKAGKAGAEKSKGRRAHGKRAAGREGTAQRRTRAEPRKGKKRAKKR